MVSLIFSTTGSNTMQRSWIRCLLLSKNQTKDEVINLVCEAACDWEGTFTCDDFFSHSQLRKLLRFITSSSVGF